MKKKKAIIIIMAMVFILAVVMAFVYLNSSKSKVQLRPIVENAGLGSLWGRDWQEWTLEDYMSTFNLEQVSNYQWINNEEDYYDAYYYNDVASLTWSPRDAKVHPVKVLTIYEDSTRTYTYNLWNGQDIEDNFSEYCKENNLKSLWSAKEYFGIDESFEKNKFYDIATDCGKANVSYDDTSITIMVDDGDEQLEIKFKYDGYDCSIIFIIPE